MGDPTVITAKVLSANVLSRQPSHGHRIMTLLVVSANYAGPREKTGSQRSKQIPARADRDPKLSLYFSKFCLLDLFATLLRFQPTHKTCSHTYMVETELLPFWLSVSLGKLRKILRGFVVALILVGKYCS